MIKDIFNVLLVLPFSVWKHEDQADFVIKIYIIPMRKYKHLPDQQLVCSILK